MVFIFFFKYMLSNITSPELMSGLKKKSFLNPNQFYFTFVHIVKCKLHKLAHALTPYRSPSPQILRMVTSLCHLKEFCLQ